MAEPGPASWRRIAPSDQLLGRLEAPAFVAAHDTFLFDCDGVLYAGDELLPGAAAAVSSLKKRGKRVLFVTNNSAKSRAGMAAQLSRLGLENVEAEDMLPSSFISARYLAKRGAQKAFVIGAAGLVEELRLAGVEVVQTGGGAKLSAEAFASFALETGVGAVVVGHDSAANFRDVAVASLYLDEDPDCLFVSTNHDAFDVVRGRKYPGNGVFVAALAVAAGRQPDATCGKPSTDLVEYIRETFLRHGEAACVVGDRLDTDMALASKLGASGLLVLTGCATAQDAARCTPGSACCPTIIAASVGCLLYEDAAAPEAEGSSTGGAADLGGVADLAGPAALRGPAALGVPGSRATTADAAIAETLDALHARAARCDASYLELFSDDAVFLGTDASERWPIDAFRAYALDRFDRRQGWAYAVRRRHVRLVGEDFGLFDEDLVNESLGACRSTGAVVRVDGDWKVAQYSLSLPIPNDRILGVVKSLSL